MIHEDTSIPVPRAPWITPQLRSAAAATATLNNPGPAGDGGTESSSISIN